MVILVMSNTIGNGACAFVATSASSVTSIETLPLLSVASKSGSITNRYSCGNHPSTDTIASFSPLLTEFPTAFPSVVVDNKISPAASMIVLAVATSNADDVVKSLLFRCRSSLSPT